jgi:hypothetical protein
MVHPLDLDAREAGRIGSPSEKSVRLTLVAKIRGNSPPRKCVIELYPKGEMSIGKKTVILLALALGIAGTVLTIVLLHRRPITLRGAVLKQDSDPEKQTPIADVDITAIDAYGIGKAKSSSLGFFSITLPRGLKRRQPITLQLRHPDYQPLDLNDYVGDKLYVARMASTRREAAIDDRPEIVVGNPVVRYSVKATEEANVGSAAKIFAVENTGNKPCDKAGLCSPDGKWTAARVTTFLDAGQCAFAAIEQEDLSQDGRRFNVSVRDWSDTTTFLLEAEVVHSMVSDVVRDSHPVIFGRALNFSLPASAEGPSIEAEIDGEAIVFPLGPNLFLRWAVCHVGVDKDQSRTYRCELKPGYRFRKQGEM